MNSSHCCIFLSLLLFLSASTHAAEVVSKGFIYETAPYPQCHASTVEESKQGIVAAWFGGKHEKHPTVGIWFSRLVNGQWTEPIEVANGNQLSESKVPRYPCWNPVLFQSSNGPMFLFYKVGPSPRDWWGEVIQSEDGGKTWSAATKIPADHLGPIKNKPIELADGTILCPSSTEHQGWQVHFESTKNGKEWSRTKSVNEGVTHGIIQPTILRLGNDNLLALCRSKQRIVVGTSSGDNGKTWSAPFPTELPNPSSGIDGVTLSNGKHALVYNPTKRKRTPLNLAISDDGMKWKDVITLESEPGEYSYPAIIQSKDGLLHITYTWKRRRVRYVVVKLQ